MGHTIFILGPDPEHCRELREILQERIASATVTAAGDKLPGIHGSDTVIITSEEKNTGVLYRHLLNKLEDQVHRAQFLGELIRLFASSHRPEEIVEAVAAKSTEVLGETAFVILANDNNKLRLDAAHSKNQDALIKILMTAVNMGHKGITSELLSGVLEDRSARLVGPLSHVETTPEIRELIDKYSFSSLIAAPIQTKDYVLGLFVTLSVSPNVFSEDDLRLAAEIADFAAIALENATLLNELQKSATTDALTGLFNTRFFNEVLARETARAERYSAPMSLLMIDVDKFKQVNDTYGHVVGNKVLTHIGRALQRAVRNTDLVFRCGGDEFAIILPGTNMEGALRAAEKVLQKVEHADILADLGYSGPVTVSIGVSEHRPGMQYEAIVAEADQALYASKRSSRNCAKAYGH